MDLTQSLESGTLLLETYPDTLSRLNIWEHSVIATKILHTPIHETRLSRTSLKG